MDDSEKLYGEILCEDLKTYRKLEYWGATLFLTGIGLTAKQLLEWDQAVDYTKRVTLQSFAVMLPALIGLGGFIFLRIVNFRGRMTNKKLYSLVKQNGKSTHGWLAWWLAAMPLAFGYGTSWYLVNGCPARREIMNPLTFIGFFVVVFAVAKFIRTIREQ